MGSYLIGNDACMFDDPSMYVLRRALGNLTETTEAVVEPMTLWKSWLDVNGDLYIKRSDNFRGWDSLDQLYASCAMGVVQQRRDLKRREVTVDATNSQALLEHMGFCQGECGRATCTVMNESARHFRRHFCPRCRQCVVYASHISPHALHCADTACKVPHCAFVKQRLKGRNHLPSCAV